MKQSIAWHVQGLNARGFGLNDDDNKAETEKSQTDKERDFLAYPTGISVNLTGARKCHLTRGM